MEFQEMVALFQKMEDKLNDLESGDLVAVVDVERSLGEAVEKLSGNDAFQDLAKFLSLNAALVNSYPRISGASKTSEFFTLLREVAAIMKGLFSRTMPGKQAASAMNALVSRIQLLRDNPAEPAEKCAEVSECYSADYFSQITDDKKMLMQLVDEVREHLDTAQFTLVELEYDDTNQENVNKVFRSFHTIKGSSAFLGLRNLEEVAHEIESLLVLVRDGKLRIVKELIDVVFLGIELLREITAIMPAQDFDLDRMVDSFKGVRIYNYIRLVRRIVENYQTRKIGEILEEEGLLSKTDVARILERQRETSEKFGEIAVQEKMVSTEEVKEAMKKQNALVKKSSYVKVSNDRLNLLVDIVGELVINQSMLKQQIMAGNDSGMDERTISQLESITTNIKNLVLSMGMVPISEIFNKLRVVIRNTAQELSKSIVVDITGEETELDRNVIEGIYDPMVHMVRNAVDHGIESAADREAAGKDRVGHIRISADHKGNGIEITIEDDGRGMSRDRIIKKAVEKGLVQQDEAVKMSDKDLYAMLFLPGFSTAEKVTEVSGRGVGLDVVKKNIDELHGRVEIVSSDGEFTRFVIKLPLTLAIIEGFVTVVGDNRYVLPFSSVEEIIVPDAARLKPMDDGSYMLFNRGVHIPLIFSGDTFRERSYSRDIAKALVVVIKFEDKNYGLVVDRVVGKQEIVVKNLGEVLQDLQIYSGGTIFGDGTIGFVVDLESFLEKTRRMSLEQKKSA